MPSSSVPLASGGNPSLASTQMNASSTSHSQGNNSATSSTNGFNFNPALGDPLLASFSHAPMGASSNQKPNPTSTIGLTAIDDNLLNSYANLKPNNKPTYEAIRRTEVVSVSQEKIKKTGDAVYTGSS